MKFPKKIPTLLGFIFIGLIVTFISGIFNAITDTQTKAYQTKTPKDVRISNQTDSGFTVTWLTDETATGLVTVANNITSVQSCLDERDLKDRLGKYYLHSAICKNLKPDTTYKFKILSDSKQFTDNNKPYSATTAPVIQSVISQLEPAFGTVVNADNSPAEGSLVYLNLENSQILSTLVKESGSWLVPLNFIRSEDLSGFLTFPERADEYLYIRNHIDQSNAVTDTLNDSPVPNIAIGKTYDFRKQQAKQPQKSLSDIKASDINLQLTPKTDVLGETVAKSYSGKISIAQPADNSSLTSSLPLFEGSAIPGKNVTLTIGITDPISLNLKAADDGIWRYTPETPLGIGKQTVTATTVDSDNKPVAITHVFSILKSGTQVLGDATPSATLTPVFTPTPISTLAAEPPPVSGIFSNTILFILLGISLMLLGTLIHLI